MVPLPEMWRSPGASEHPKQGYSPSETKAVFPLGLQGDKLKLGPGLAQWTWQRVGKSFLGKCTEPSFPSFTAPKSAPAGHHGNEPRQAKFQACSGVRVSRRGENFTLDVVHFTQGLRSVSRYLFPPFTCNSRSFSSLIKVTGTTIRCHRNT